MEIFPDALAEAFLRVSRRLRRETQQRIAPLGLNLHQSRALRVIAEAGPLRPSALAGRLGIVARSATDAVAGLLSAGFVLRRTDPADGRAQLLVISPAGCAALEEVSRIRAEVGAALFGRLTPPEREALASILARLDAADETPSAGRPTPPQTP
jgi:DNA-binding MarR family transcriptional regulator